MIQNLKDLEYQLYIIPEPTYFFRVGDKVTIGNLIDVFVTKGYFDGKGYEIDYTGYNHNYGNPIYTPHRRRIVAWYEIRKPYCTEESLIQNKDIQLNYSQRSMTDILGKAHYFGIDMNPEYQREYVWTSEDKVNLIDSIFNNIDIGKFVFNKLPFKEKSPSYEIVDGKQRVSAICDFFEDKFQYKGRYFSDLSRRDQSWFENHTVSIAEIDNADRKQIMKIFLMINTNGKIMDKKHLDKVREEYNRLFDRPIINKVLPQIPSYIREEKVYIKKSKVKLF